MKENVPRARFDAFSDGVFAIAVTIMVLEFKLPAEIPATAGSSQIFDGLLNLFPVLIAYIISFSILSQMWLSHSRLPTPEDGVHTGGAQLNLLFLFFVCLIPFPTVLLGQFGLQTVTLIPYEITVMGASTVLGLVRLSLLKRAQAPKGRVKLQGRRIAMSIVVSVAALACAVVGANSAPLLLTSLILAALAPLVYRIVR